MTGLLIQWDNSSPRTVPIPVQLNAPERCSIIDLATGLWMSGDTPKAQHYMVDVFRSAVIKECRGQALADWLTVCWYPVANQQYKNKAFDVWCQPCGRTFWGDVLVITHDGHSDNFVKDCTLGAAASICYVVSEYVVPHELVTRSSC